jgi:hypothetical protein
MTEFVLAREAWPRLPAPHAAFLEAALPLLRADRRLVGVAAGGSFIHGALDAYSDLDLVVVSAAPAADEMMRERPALARQLGPLLVAFTGEHVGAPSLLICLYGPPPLHVDLKFVTADQLAKRVEDPVVLWDRDGSVRAGLAAGRAAYPQPEAQWIEDRFWPWVHYITVKIARGELFEALDALAFIRGRVLGPLILAAGGAQPNGVRRIESHAPERIAPLRATLGAHDRTACRDALLATIALYRELRESHSPPDLLRRPEAERTAMEFLAEELGG